MLQVGQKAPSFELPGVAGGHIDAHTLDEYTENGWTVVLVFYPFDFHPSCTTQLCLLRDSEDLSLVENTVVLGISTDSVYSHQAFAEQHRVNFPLLSDSDASVSQGYGVLVEEIEGHRDVPRSALFVVDPDSEIQYAWQSDAPESYPDLAAVRKATNCQGGRCTIPEGKSHLV